MRQLNSEELRLVSAGWLDLELAWIGGAMVIGALAAGLYVTPMYACNAATQVLMTPVFCAGGAAVAGLTAVVVSASFS